MTWLDALLSAPWHQWVVMTFGTAGIVMTQIETTQRYACWPGLIGQFGWAGGLVWTPSQVGMCVVSIVCCCAWIWGLWRYWLRGWLDMDEMPTDGPLTPRPVPARSRKKPKLRLVRGSGQDAPSSQ